MSTVEELHKVLNELHVTCDDIEYGFSCIARNVDIDLHQVLSTFVEDEGLTIVASVEYLRKTGFEFKGRFAKLRVEAYTSLDLVGLTAAISTALAQEDLASNVIAAFHRDYIFVQYEQKEKAIEAIVKLR